MKDTTMTYRNLLKSLLGALFYYCGLFHTIRFINNVRGRRLTIVTYHRVTNKNLKDITFSLPYLFVHRETFEKQLEFLGRHYRIIRFEVLDENARGKAIPRNSLIVTFDDGYEDFHHHAYPVLRRHRVPATLFVTASKVGGEAAETFWWDRAYYCLAELKQREERGAVPELHGEVKQVYEEFKRNPAALFAGLNGWDGRKVQTLLEQFPLRNALSDKIHARENRMLTWRQIAEMNGDVQIGSHTLSHHNLLELEDDLRRREIADSSKAIRQHLNGGKMVLSYPGGKTDRRVKKLVEDCGYEYAVGTEPGVNDLSDRYALKRINIWEGTAPSPGGGLSTGLFALKLLGF